MELNSIFSKIRDKLDEHYDRRERLIKISRDITSLSKKMIFSLQRIQGEVKEFPSRVQKELEQRENDIQALLQKAEPDLQGSNADRYQRQISPGVQEYVEALVFRHYILHKNVPSPSELQESYFRSLPLSNEDYVLGVADFTGELMRRAISNVSSRQGHVIAIESCNSLRELQRSFLRLYVPSGKASRGFASDLNFKIEVMKQSVSKVENACYNIQVRGSEKPDGWTIDLKEESYKRAERDGSDDDEFGRGKRRRLNED